MLLRTGHSALPYPASTVLEWYLSMLYCFIFQVHKGLKWFALSTSILKYLFCHGIQSMYTFLKNWPLEIIYKQNEYLAEHTSHLKSTSWITIDYIIVYHNQLCVTQSEFLWFSHLQIMSYNMYWVFRQVTFCRTQIIAIRDLKKWDANLQKWKRSSISL